VGRGQERTAKYDPGNAYSINYMWGTTGIGLNVEKVKESSATTPDRTAGIVVFDPANMEKLPSCGVHCWTRRGDDPGRAQLYRRGSRQPRPET
jgi:spermidine/putrescine-binding protein